MKVKDIVKKIWVATLKQSVSVCYQLETPRELSNLELESMQFPERDKTVASIQLTDKGMVINYY